MQHLRLLALLPFLLVAALAPAPAAAQSFYGTFIGDSLTTGLFATAPPQTYVAQLEHYWPANSYTAIGIPGATAAPAGSPWGPSIEGYVAQVPPQTTYLVIEIGTNDLEIGRTDAQFWDDYRALVANLKRQAPSAKLLCLGPWDDPTYNTGAASTGYFDNIVYSACGGSAIDISNIFAKPNTRGPAGRATAWGPADGFHPNDLGHSWLAYEISQTSTSQRSGIRPLRSPA
jgi:lysophospholipase L1-like esterase